ncbi:hypothetical protein DC432_00920 [Microbacterium testaceum]|uniref:Uncharacterized protein n=1 Tax=Microbacterium testaceum TaxID=2033 RepID=A0A2T7WX05_MICTE|nr:hypothetical protein DC432_00920 [Microbacterium testaceum]
MGRAAAGGVGGGLGAGSGAGSGSGSGAGSGVGGRGSGSGVRGPGSGVGRTQRRELSRLADHTAAEHGVSDNRPAVVHGGEGEQDQDRGDERPDRTGRTRPIPHRTQRRELSRLADDTVAEHGVSNNRPAVAHGARVTGPGPGRRGA